MKNSAKKMPGSKTRMPTGIANKILRCLAVFATWYFSLTAFAFSTDLSHQVATTPAELLLDSATKWDSESSSDYITYQRPLAWDGLWYRSNKSFDLSVGSISNKQFATYRRLKLYQELSERVEFRLHWLEERDFEQDRATLPLELKFKLAERLAFSFFGRPSLYKSENDVGASLFFKPSPDGEIQLSAVWGDFQRNQRNLQTDEWSEAPVGWTLTMTRLPEDKKVDFRRVQTHWEPLSVRSDNGVKQDSLSYLSYYLSALHTREQGGQWGWRVFYDRAFHSDQNNDVKVRKRSLNQLEYSFVAGPHTIKPGLNLFYRENRTNGEKTIFREILPTLWFDLPVRASEWSTRMLSIGYDATVFHKTENQHDENDSEHRLNIKWNVNFAKAGQLALLFTFDLDRFGTGETWEGGAGQFRLDF